MKERDEGKGQGEERRGGGRREKNSNNQGGSYIYVYTKLLSYLKKILIGNVGWRWHGNSQIFSCHLTLPPSHKSPSSFQHTRLKMLMLDGRHDLMEGPDPVAGRHQNQSI